MLVEYFIDEAGAEVWRHNSGPIFPRLISQIWLGPGAAWCVATSEHIWRSYLIAINGDRTDLTFSG